MNKTLKSVLIVVVLVAIIDIFANLFLVRTYEVTIDYSIVTNNRVIDNEIVLEETYMQSPKLTIEYSEENVSLILQGNVIDKTDATNNIQINKFECRCL